MLSMSASGGKADVDQPMLTNLDLSFSRQGPPSLACDSGKASVTQGRLWRGAPDMGIRLLGFLALLWASAGLGCYPMCYPELLTLLFFGGPGRIRTFNPLLRRQMLYTLSYWTLHRRLELSVLMVGRSCPPRLTRESTGQFSNPGAPQLIQRIGYWISAFAGMTNYH